MNKDEKEKAQKLLAEYSVKTKAMTQKLDKMSKVYGFASSDNEKSTGEKVKRFFAKRKDTVDEDEAAFTKSERIKNEPEATETKKRKKS